MLYGVCEIVIAQYKYKVFSVHSSFPLQMQGPCIWKAIAGILKEVLSVFKIFFPTPYNWHFLLYYMRICPERCWVGASVLLRPPWTSSGFGSLFIPRSVSQVFGGPVYQLHICLLTIWVISRIRNSLGHLVYLSWVCLSSKLIYVMV